MIDTSSTMAPAIPTWKAESIKRKQTIQRFMNDHSIELTSSFVPWSQSRHAKDKAHAKDKTLNWKVTVSKGNRVILTTDFSAGIAHCPSYKQGERWTIAYTDTIDYECEQGHTCKSAPWGKAKGNPIKPDYIDVLHCLVSDSNVLDYGKFEDWANEYGYDADSRSAESIYRSCLEIALSLRAGLGDSTLAKLNDLFQDY